MRKPFLILLASLLINIVPAFAANEVLINEVELNPAGTDSGFEKLELFNPSSSTVDVGGWTISSTAGRTATVTISSGTSIPANGYIIIGRPSQWLDNVGEIIELRDNSDALIDSVGPFSDEDNDEATWQRSPDGQDNWLFTSETLGSANFGTFVPEPESSPPEPEPEPEPQPKSEDEPESSPPPNGVENGTEVEPNHNLTVIFIDVGQGDSILVILPNGKSMLIDGGERESSDEVLATLNDYSINHIDVIIATHPHADHIGGLIDVVNEVSIGQVLDSGQIHTTKTFEDLLDAIEAKQIPLTSVSEGDTINLDASVKLEVLNPPESLQEDIEDEINNNSVVIKLTYGEFTTLFTGDMEEFNEQRLVDSNSALDVDVLKAGHHGSRYSSIEAFLRAVSPEVVVISAGANNTYGHPHQEALDRVTAVGTEHVFRTDFDGTIVLTANGSDEYSIVTERGKTVVVPEFEVVMLVSAIALISIVAYTRLGITWKR